MSITRALTPEEWREVLTGYGCHQDPPEDWSTGDDPSFYAVPAAEEGKYHRAAALCLHGQPFGFTREDVELLRQVHEQWDGEFANGNGYGPLLSIIDRIEALLPPEDLTP